MRRTWMHLVSAIRLGFLSGTILLLDGCNPPAFSSFQGYVEGEFVYLSSATAGRLERLQVSRGQQITNGAPLFILEAEPESAAWHQAQQEVSAAEAQLADLHVGKRPQELDVLQAQLNQAEASARQAATELTREEAVFRANVIPASQLDQTRATADVCAARVNELKTQIDVARLPAREDQIRAQQAVVAAARAARTQAEWRLNQKAVRATQSALVFDTLFHEGEWVTAGVPVLSLLPPQLVKIRFFVPESRLGALRLGQPVTIHCDGATDITARISYISTQAEYTPPVIYSNETRTKLVFLVEATPALEAATGLHPGQPVEVRPP